MDAGWTALSQDASISTGAVLASVLHCASIKGGSEILHESCATSTIQLAAPLFEPSQHVFLQRASSTSCAVQLRHLSTHHHSTRASAQRRAELRSNHEAPSVPPPVGRRTV